LQVRLGLVEPSLVGQDLSDVAVGQRTIGRPAGAVAALPGSLIQRDRLVPAAVEVGEHAQVVQDGGLMLGIAELLEQLERAPRVRRLLGPAGLD
jgi:hypothetical protein